MSDTFTIGLDFGTNSTRAIIVNTATGAEIATAVFEYPSGEKGVILDSKNPDLARQHPTDYVEGMTATVTTALKEAASVPGFSAASVIGIGVDTTGSTPLPVDKKGMPLAFYDEFTKHPAALAWLWKDHTSHAEAVEITEMAQKMRPQYLAKCGGAYSSEWFWSKILQCKRTSPEVFQAAYTWVEHADWMTAILTGTDQPETMKRCICAAGHKAMFNPSWGGYPDVEFLSAIDPDLARIRESLPDEAYTIADAAGLLCEEWADKLGLPTGIPVAMGAFDAHLGAVGSGIQPGVMVKIIGTSCCDMMVAPMDQALPDIPGLCGIVPGSILPGCFGLEAGQSAVGDIFNWFVSYMRPENETHESLTEKALLMKPGESGLLALDWHNGNRTVLVDQRLTGAVVGMTLQTRPEELYRALIEATAFGARVIMERFLEYGMPVERIVNCGGISGKNALLMQIYADVMGRPLEISKSTQTCALGAAMAGAVVAGKEAGGYNSFAEAAAAMAQKDDKIYYPIPENEKIYDSLFALYKKMHDSFGVQSYQEGLYVVMKELLSIRDASRKE
ncbi:MAG: ribulokinase [Candidatus Hydrogenedentes bacterium]|jgi:L-ribulokinase|nr:ribulokinase [Candidatus Hydrogenedentota bacterium]